MISPPVVVQSLSNELPLPFARCYQWVVVTRGYVVRNSRGERIRINAGEVHLGLPHTPAVLEECSDDIEGSYCCVLPAFIEQGRSKLAMKSELSFIGSYMTRYPLSVPPATLGRLLHLLACLSRFSSNELLTQAYLYTLTMEVYVLLATELPLYPPAAYSLTQRYIALLEEYVLTQHTLSFYASQLRISANHLNKSVRIITGDTAQQLLVARIMVEAKRLLSEGLLSVSDIAYQLGYTDPSYFARSFRRSIGMSPLAYRQAWNS